MPITAAIGNRLLAAFPAAERRRLIPEAETVPLAYGEQLFGRGEAPRHVYFPQAGLVSLVQRLADGASVQVAAIGKDGVVGLAGALGEQAYLMNSVVQVPGVALRLRASSLRRALRRSPGVTRAIMANGARLCVEIAHMAACNAHHTLEQRLARWLIAAHDSVDQGEISISHGFLSTMLGTQRTGITAALANFKRARLVDTGYGGITILDRKALEAMSCECYRNVRRLYAAQAPARRPLRVPEPAR